MVNQTVIKATITIIVRLISLNDKVSASDTVITFSAIDGCDDGREVGCIDGCNVGWHDGCNVGWHVG